MRQLILITVILVFISGEIAECQDKNDVPRQLEVLYHRLIVNYDDQVRIRISDSINVILDEYVKSDTVFTRRFTNLRYLGEIVSPDSVVKIISWNLVLQNQPGKYFCYFIKKQRKGEKNLIYSLSTAYNEMPAYTDTTYSCSDWYGALYYAINPVVNDNNTFWMLLGIDYGNQEITRKIIDVLSFKSDSSLVLGKNWFISDDKRNYRVVFEYASTARMTLRFRSDSSVVFDHLVPFSSSKSGMLNAPEYSFDAYEFKNGKWRLVRSVDVRNRE